MKNLKTSFLAVLVIAFTSFMLTGCKPEADSPKHDMTIEINFSDNTSLVFYADYNSSDTYDRAAAPEPALMTLYYQNGTLVPSSLFILEHAFVGGQYTLKSNNTSAINIEFNTTYKSYSSYSSVIITGLKVNGVSYIKTQAA